jgi:hypothetical protein
MDYKLKETVVIDDIVPLDFQNKIEETLMNYPNWRFVKDMSYANYDMEYPSYGFNMMFKHPDHPNQVSPLYESLSVPIINALIEKTKIKIENIHFNRAFLQLPLADNFVKERNGIHLDLPVDHYACIYYVNDSDGDTILYEQTRYNTECGSQNVSTEEHKRVTPKKGRVVLFDGARFHCSTQPRNIYRCIINFDLI